MVVASRVRAIGADPVSALGKSHYKSFIEVPNFVLDTIGPFTSLDDLRSDLHEGRRNKIAVPMLLFNLFSASSV